MFASIKPGGHFERKTRSARGKKPSKSPLLREKKKTSTRAEIARDERLATFTRRRKRRQNIDRELFDRIQIVPVAISRVLWSKIRVDYKCAHTYRLYQSPQLRARGPDVLVVLPSAAASAATAASASAAASVAAASASVASVAAATEAARKSSSVRFFSHCLRVLCFVCLFACKKVKTNERKKN